MPNSKVKLKTISAIAKLIDKVCVNFCCEKFLQLLL